MFVRHVKRELSAYAHSELPAGESARVARHLDTCPRCRAGYEEIKLGVRLAECLPRRTAPARVWDEIEAALARCDTAGATSTGETTSRASLGGLLGGASRGPRLFGRRPALVACTLVAALACAAAAWLYVGSTRQSWEVVNLAGATCVDDDRIGEKGRLGVGQWLETDANSRAEIKVANIGEVEVEPQTRLRLVETGLTEHRLELARGRMHARIWAPPRLFFVETPSAVAADLGCAYTLETDEHGRSLLQVTSGWVAFETEHRESIVPAGAACVTRPGVGPGTPYFEDASAPFVAALSRFDFDRGGREALGAVLSEARARDTLTLWHLLARTSGEERARVYEGLARLAPPPSGVTREGVLLLDPIMLHEWKAHLEETWFTGAGYNVKGTWRKLGEWLGKNPQKEPTK
jgi:FecR protein/Putative zinc-finger